MSYLPINEGVDHLNVYSKSKLPIGRSLSNFHLARFKHTQDGDFLSVEGYWYWLATGSKRDEFRLLSGVTAKTEGQQRIKKSGRVEVPDFNERVLEAIRCKLRQNRDILKGLTNTTLPLTHYYWYGEIDNPTIVDCSKHQWQIDELVRIRGIMRAKEGLS